MIKGKQFTLKISIFWLLRPILSKAFFAKCTMEMKIPKYHILETPQIIGFFIFYCYYYLFFFIFNCHSTLWYIKYFACTWIYFIRILTLTKIILHCLNSRKKCLHILIYLLNIIKLGKIVLCNANYLGLNYITLATNSCCLSNFTFSMSILPLSISFFMLCFMLELP